MKVKLYSTSTCTYCQAVREYLEEKKIKFEEVYVDSNEQKHMEMQERSGQMNVPVLDIDGMIIVGFDTTVLNEALNIKTTYD